MKQFRITQLCVGVGIALTVLTTTTAFAEGEKISVKVSAPKEGLANDKNAKKMLKSMPWSPCVAVTTTYGTLTGKDEKKVSGVSVKVGTNTQTVFADKMQFDITLGNKSGTYNAYFFLVAPDQGVIHYASSSVTQFTTTNSGKAVTLPAPSAILNGNYEILAFTSYSYNTTTKKFPDGKFETFVRPYLWGDLEAAAKLTSNTAHKKVTVVMNFDNQGKIFNDYKKDYTYGVNNIINTTTYSSTFKQGVWHAVGVMAPTNISDNGLTTPASWLAFDVQPFILGNPLTNLNPVECK